MVKDILCLILHVPLAYLIFALLLVSVGEVQGAILANVQAILGVTIMTIILVPLAYIFDLLTKRR